MSAPSPTSRPDRVFPHLAAPTLFALATFAIGCTPPTIESTTRSTTERFARDLEPLAPTALAGGDPTGLSIPAMGAARPSVIVSIFTDYQCPNCRRAHDVAQRLVDRWPGSVQVQFRHLPLAQHPLAIPAAIAAQAAHRQGRFTCMHAALIKTRPLWTSFELLDFRAFLVETLVPRCGLDDVAFRRDLDDSSLERFVVDQREHARDIGVLGTPALLVNGLEADAWPRPGHPPARLVNALVRRELRDTAAMPTPPECLASPDPACTVAARVLANTGDPWRTRLILGAPF